MGEETSDAMNLDLNLGSGPEPASATMSIEPVNLENWIDQRPMHQMPEVFGISPFRRRWPQPGAHNVWSGLNQLMVDSGTSSILQAGEGSVAAEERSNDVLRDLVQPTEDTPRETAAERTNGLLNRILTSRALRREQNQLAQPEIVVLTQDNITSLDTGENRRLQSMLLRRTQSHIATLSSLSSALSSAERLVEAYFHNHPITPAVRNQEPPPPVDDRDSFSSIQAVINSESQMDTAVEIDSMVSLSASPSRRRSEASRVSDMDSEEPCVQTSKRADATQDGDSNLKIPLRPQAPRDESLRQTIQRSAFTFPVEEMIRRLGSRFDLSRDLVQPTEDTPQETAAERTNGLLNRILTSRALRREQIQLAQTEIVDLTQANITSLDTGDNRRLQSMLLRRTQSHRATLSSLSSALSSAERLVEAYFHNHPITPAVRNQEPPPPVDDRDSFSSIQAVINSESQMDTAVEIDSMVSLSTSSSRRRNEASRVSDMDSGDSRAPRRRRLN
ncbi:hypothetical protein RchiOBHm_Chr3g0479381 [Rosa chinensis]|uniref:Uncharacterized protein n=1 Tax=Rosa chinensis TaxID=74649 RepID=A0A2P6RDF5_ROSCH|nr:uncharacterized protein LOC112192669 [Rosa chinensis]XP_024188272.1 uncharacterized protein LOC112192669 [Rosa chinensis]XP_040372371.1 uncharacterized protein LOC112192669 [Rosa chinensis]XP_040372372.1 uncharacterized protein LOC112192669 [Rosa chinensis]PRQ44448.1 hypothetical protein RchiOBHm_Chr3g0479381 [Rosa chinensis]